MAVWPNPSQLYPPFWKQTWQTPEPPGKESSTRNSLSLHQGMGATVSGPQRCRSLWSCLLDAGGSSLSLICPPASAPVTVALAAIMHPCRDDRPPSSPSDLSAELLLGGVPPPSLLARLQQMQRSSSSCLSTPLAWSPAPAAPLTKLYPSPSRIHHSRPPRHLLLHQQYSPRCSRSAGCQRCPARSACTFPVCVASSAALTPQPTGTAGILSGSPGLPLCPAKPPAFPLSSCFMLLAR